MKRIKWSHKILCLALAALFLCLSLVGCQKRENGKNGQIVCTSFAAYDWIRAILGDSETLSVSLLVSSGADLHSYQPTVADKVKLSESEMVVYIGGESDAWVGEWLAQASGVRAVCLSEIEGVTLRNVSEHGDGEGEAHLHEEGEEHAHASFDEHIWLSPKNAAVLTAYLAQELAKIDEENAALYRGNAEAYQTELALLGEAYAEMVAASQNRRVIVADRFPFVYLVEEYGISYCAAFAGCTTENEAGFETVVRLSRQADEWEARYLLVTESSDRKLAGSVIAATKDKNQEILSMNSMQAISSERIDSGVSYLSLMYENLDILRKALS